MSKIQKFSQKSDVFLVKLSLENQDYFRYLVSRYEQKLLFYIRRISGLSYEDAQDVLQEVFIKIFLNLNDFDLGLKFSSWAYRIAHNVVISHYRKLKARPQVIVEREDYKILDNLVSDFNLPQKMDQVILRKKIEKVLFKLDSKYSEVLILKYFEQKSYGEMSDILKKPKGTIATLLNRAKKKFREYLKNKGIKL